MTAILVGNSLTRGINMEKGRTICRPGATIDDIKNEIESKRITLDNFSMIMILLGTIEILNGMAVDEVVDLVYGFWRMICRLYPESKVRWIELPPVTRSTDNYDADLVNSRLQSVNQGAQDLGVKLRRTCFLFDGNSYISYLYAIDGLHFSDYGKELMQMVANDQYQYHRPSPRALTFFGLRHPRSYLSNFFPCKFTIDGITFNCVEQYYQWKKCKETGHDNLAKKVMKLKSAAAQKGTVKDIPFDDIQRFWTESVKYNIMLEGVRQKFSQNPELRTNLIDTGDKHLVEGCATDLFWGCGYGPWDPRSTHVQHFPGLNCLGEILSIIRAELQEENA